MVILKERGWTYFAGLFAGSVVFALFFGGIVSKALGVVMA
jgi:hypothetical protein